MIDTDALEQEQDVLGTEGTESGSQQEHVELPKPGPTQDRQDIRDAALEDAGNEASQENVIDTLAAKDGEITIEDLRRLPGAEGKTDQELQLEWARAVKAAGNAEAQEETQTTEAFKLPFPVYDKEGNKVEALEKISVRDLFEGKLQLSYQALGKEQRKTLAEALRNASMGHWNEQKYNITVDERNRVATEAQGYKDQVEKFTKERQVWDAALTALSMGDINPMKHLAQAYQAQLTNVQQATPQGYLPVDQVRAEQEAERQGNEFIRTTIVPAIDTIVTQYGAKRNEVEAAVEWFIKREPAQFLTAEKIDSILKFDVPNLLENSGYSATGTVSQQTATKPSELDDLKKTVAALQERIAEKKNTQVQTIREKQKKAPPSGGGATPGAGDSMPSFKSRSQMKAWMQNDENWAKA